MNNLNEIVNEIATREDLVSFIGLLSEDFRSNSQGWENIEVDSYLLALGAWVKDMDGYFGNVDKDVPARPTWKLFGQILLAAKYYE